MKIFCFSSLFAMIVNEMSLVFGLLLDKRSNLKMILWPLGNCDEHFPPSFDIIHLYQMVNEMKLILAAAL